MSTRGGTKNDLKMVIQHQSETINQLTANVFRYQEFIADEIYRASCRLSQCMPYEWNDIPEHQKETWRQRADESVLRFEVRTKARMKENALNTDEHRRT